MGKDYLIKTAEAGKQYEWVWFFYLPGETCQNCGKEPISNCFVFKHKETGDEIIVGSECAKNMENWGYALDHFKLFKKKFKIYKKLMGITSREQLKGLKLTLKDIDEKIEQIRKEKESQKHEKWLSQKDLMNKYLQIKYYNSFVNDVCNRYFLEEQLLTDKQLEALERNYQEVINKFGSIEKFNVWLDQQRLADVMLSNLKRCSVWKKHEEIIDSLSEWSLGKGNRFTDKQFSLIKKLFYRYRKQIIKEGLWYETDLQKLKLEKFIEEGVMV